jgi:hypothetical protein
MCSRTHYRISNGKLILNDYLQDYETAIVAYLKVLSQNLSLRISVAVSGLKG